MKSCGFLRPVLIIVFSFLVFPLSSVSVKETSYISKMKPFLTDFTKSGEGYFNPEGSQMVLQAEGEKGNPFYQIYSRDMNTKDVKRISLGWGKTTCSWAHPKSTHEKPWIFFSSTHAEGRDKSLEKQRSFKKTRRYSWDYDSSFDVFEYKDGEYKRITNSLGYDAEGSLSPDGRWFVYASNSWAYKKYSSSVVDKNPSYYIDLFVMDLKTKKTKRITNSLGYDGGPFFSPDGKRVTWRRFSKDGRTAEVFTINKDGSDEKQITRLNAMSWAPFYHPSQEYIVFTTSVHGHRNFELYVVDVKGDKSPIRITNQEGFDGLPVFHPQKNEIYWVYKDPKKRTSLIYKGQWNHEKVKEALFSPRTQISQDKLKNWVQYLSSKELKGRDTGSPEEKVYSKRLEKTFKSYGFKVFSKEKSRFQFIGQRDVLKTSFLKVKNKTLEVHKNWLPVSGTSQPIKTSVVFADYGLEVPQGSGYKPFSSYKKNVKGKWALVLEGLPSKLSSKKRAYYFPYSHIESKILAARKKGALGLLIATKHPLSQKQPLHFDTFPVAYVSYDLIKSLQEAEVEGLFKFQDKIKTAHNTLGFLKVKGAQNTLVIGAHGDHLGEGAHPSSYDEGIHTGADDNASGVAAVMELARLFSQPEIKAQLKQNILFAVWSGEELGLLGSESFMKKNLVKNISAYINMDMIGRLRDTLYVQGLESSPDWKGILKHVNPGSELQPHYDEDVFLSSDSTSFYMRNIPILSFFTGSHKDYHSQRDTWDKINYKGLFQVTEFVKQVAQNLAYTEKTPRFGKPKVSPRNLKHRRRMSFQVFLGTLPDYSYKKGLKLLGVKANSPAFHIGLKRGDIITKIDKKEIKNIYDYVYALSELQPRKKARVEWVREKKTYKGFLTPEPRKKSR